MLLRAFPNPHITIEDLIAEGDRIAVRNTVTATQTGEYMGRPPIGKPVTYSEMFVVRFVGGRVARDLGGSRRPLTDAVTRHDPDRIERRPPEHRLPTIQPVRVKTDFVSR